MKSYINIAGLVALVISFFSLPMTAKADGVALSMFGVNDHIDLYPSDEAAACDEIIASGIKFVRIGPSSFAATVESLLCDLVVSACIRFHQSESFSTWIATALAWILACLFPARDLDRHARLRFIYASRQRRYSSRAIHHHYHGD